MNIDPQQLLRRWLAEELAAGMKKNPAFSLRALAKRLKMSSAALSEILSGKRQVSETRAVALAKLLKHASGKPETLARAFNATGSLKRLQKVVNPNQEDILPKDLYALFADWRAFAVASLLRADRIADDGRAGAKIGQRLDISAAAAASTLKRLIKVGMVEVQPDGYFKTVPKVFRSPDEYPKSLIDKRVSAGLANAKDALRDPERWHRTCFSTISVDVSKLDDAMQMIEDFVKRLSVFLSEGERTEVFELSAQLFSLTQLHDKG